MILYTKNILKMFIAVGFVCIGDIQASFSAPPDIETKVWYRRHPSPPDNSLVELRAYIIDRNKQLFVVCGATKEKTGKMRGHCTIEKSLSNARLKQTYISTGEWQSTNDGGLSVGMIFYDPSANGATLCTTLFSDRSCIDLPFK